MITITNANIALCVSADLDVSKGERIMPRVIAAWKKTSRLDGERST